VLQGKKLTFDEASLALYDAVAPVRPNRIDAVLAQLSGGAAGEGSLIVATTLRAGLRHPTQPPRPVFQEAIRGCRARTPA
jgi:hypothetical protein